MKSRPAPPADLTPGELRSGLGARARRLQPAADVTCDPLGVAGRAAEWVATPGVDAGRVMLYLHGGGWVVGSITTHRDLATRLSRATGHRSLLIDYRLAPEDPHPAAVEDAGAAYRWLLDEGIDPARIVIAGDSAGGGLTVATLVALRDAGVPLPAAGVCLSPWIDLEGGGESMKARAHLDPMVQRDPLLQMAAMYLGGADPRTPLAAPLHADLRGLPPLLVQVGHAETLYDDSARLATRARAAGVDVTLDAWDDMIHVWQIFAPMLPEGQQAIDAIGDWVRKRVA